MNNLQTALAVVILFAGSIQYSFANPLSVPTGQIYWNLSDVSESSTVIDGTLHNVAHFTNTGNVRNNGVFQNHLDFTNNGHVDNYGNTINHGNFVNNGTIKNYSLITNRGDYNNSGTIENMPGGILVNEFLNRMNSNGNIINRGGTVLLANGSVTGGLDFQVGSIQQSSGRTSIGTDIRSSLTITGGELLGNGRVDTLIGLNESENNHHIIQDTVISPGNYLDQYSVPTPIYLASPGRLTLAAFDAGPTNPDPTGSSNIELLSGNVLSMDIGGLTPDNEHDVLELWGNAYIAPGTKIELVGHGGFVPEDGDFFDIVVSQFSSLDAADFNINPVGSMGWLNWEASVYDSGRGGSTLRVTASAVPLPPGILLLATSLGAAGILAARCRGKTLNPDKH